jgi:predicted DNA-binding transcriptional regulator YafY
MMTPSHRESPEPRLQIVHSLYVALTILERLLESHGPVTAEALARVLSPDGTSPVSRGVRTIRRSLRRFEALGFSFVPQASVRGIHIPQAFRQKLHVLNFTEDELRALAFHLVLLGEMVEGTALHGALATVYQKIGLGVGALYSRDALHHAFLPFQKAYKTYSSPARQTILTAVVRAVHASHVCQMRYRTPHASRDWVCVVHLYTLFEYEGGLYVFAHLPEEDRVVMLAVERLRHLTVRADTYSKLPQVWQQIARKRARAFGMLDDEEALDVVVKFTAEQAPYVQERVWHESQSLQVQADGSLLLRMQASGRFEIVRWLLCWGEHVEVLEPQALRQEVAAHLRLAAQQYAAHLRVPAAEGQ